MFTSVVKTMKCESAMTQSQTHSTNEITVASICNHKTKSTSSDCFS